MKIFVFDSNLLKFLSEGAIGNKTALVQLIARRQTWNKSLLEPMLTRLTDEYFAH